MTSIKYSFPHEELRDNKAEFLVGIISSLDNDELNEVITACQDRKKRLNSIKKLSFSVGEEVWFSEKGMKVFGNVVKINRKYIVVKTDEMTQWRIAPVLLNKGDE